MHSIPFSPEVHIKCEVHELLTDFWHRQDIERDAHRHRGATVHWPHSSVVANLSRRRKDKPGEALLLCKRYTLTPKLLRRALMSILGTFVLFRLSSCDRRGTTRQDNIVHQITAADFQWEKFEYKEIVLIWYSLWLYLFFFVLITENLPDRPNIFSLRKIFFDFDLVIRKICTY